MRIRRVVAESVASARVEYSPETGLYVGHVPGLSGAHSQGVTGEELRRNLEEGVLMLLEDVELGARSD